VAGTQPDNIADEKFARNGGGAIAVLGGIVVLGFLIGWLADTDEIPLWVPASALLGGVLIWTSTIRPRVLVQGTDLVLRNMIDTTRIPLAAIDEVVVRQVMAVRAGEKRYVCAGAGRSLRQAMRGSPSQLARQQAGALTGELSVDMEPGIQYADFVENRVRELVRKDRTRLGISAYSPEAADLATHVRREWAWPDIASLVVTSAFLVIAILLS
jgi:hypothetical protein